MMYTLEEQKQHRRELVKALRYGGYKQAQHSLRSGDSFCCLGVACDISGLGEWHHKSHKEIKYLNAFGILPKAVMEYYGFVASNGKIDSRYNRSLVHLNDKGTSFKKIANIIEKEPPGMFI